MVVTPTGCHNQGVTVGISEVDLGPCRARRYDAGAPRWSIILPGAMYLPDAPLLWFAREAVMASGYNVLAVWDTFDHRGHGERWVDERFAAAIEAVPDQVPLLIAKSLTTLAAGGAARRRLPAVWLTPLLSHEHPAARAVIAGLRAGSAASLLVGGLADESWDGEVARSLPHARVVEVADADHVLQVPGDPGRSIEALATVTAAVTDFAVGVQTS